ncbi:phosphoribosyltransferase [Devosia sp. 1635]|uniref:ComF family protein n=1 Tax=Devosia sp. 1635 TaxID=2726066 RepID=UPI001562F5BE|nr:phosphoribosyltransferase [Devosia sp. 1635]
MSATKFDHHADRDALIFYLGDYLPWSWHKAGGGDGSNYPSYSGRILDLKESKAASLKRFEELLLGEIKREYIGVTAVPSHDPEKGINTGVRLLAKQVASKLRVVDGRAFLRRTYKIDKLAGGGDRSLKVHLDSLCAENSDQFAGGTVLLLDDVLTSGNSLVACRQKLLDAGAKEVVCVALGRTKN